MSGSDHHSSLVTAVITRVFATLLAATVTGVLPVSAALAAEPGIVRIESHHSVAETVERLEALLREHGIEIFAHFDFTADAARAGLKMRPEQLLIFGNPKAGTPLMQAQPTAGLDLPLKALVWQDADGHIAIAYNDPQYVLRRHGLPATLSGNIAAVIPLLQRAAAE